MNLANPSRSVFAGILFLGLLSLALAPEFKNHADKKACDKHLKENPGLIEAAKKVFSPRTLEKIEVKIPEGQHCVFEISQPSP